MCCTGYACYGDLLATVSPGPRPMNYTVALIKTAGTRGGGRQGAERFGLLRAITEDVQCTAEHNRDSEESTGMDAYRINISGSIR